MRSLADWKDANNRSRLLFKLTRREWSNPQLIMTQEVDNEFIETSP
jgi:hypothetical protein